MKRAVLAIIFLCLVSVAYAEVAQQDFLQSYLFSGYNSYSRGAAIDNSNNVYIAIQKDNSTTVFSLIKTDVDGDLQWSREFTVPGIVTSGEDVATDSLGNVYALSSYYNFSFSPARSDFFLLKYDSDGNILFNRTYGRINRSFERIAIDSSNNLYILTTTTSGSAGDEIFKLDVQGNFLANVTFPYGIDIVALTTDSSNDVVASGYFLSGGTYLGKFDTSLVQLWNASYEGSEGDDAIYDVVTDDSNNVYGLGYTFNGVYYDILIQKFSSSGTSLLNSVLDTGGDAEAYHITLDSADSVVIAAMSYAGDYGLFILKLNATGEEALNYQDTDFGPGAGPADAFFDSSGNLLVVNTYQSNASLSRYSFGNSIQGTNASITLSGIDSVNVLLDNSPTLTGNHFGSKVIEIKNTTTPILNWSHHFGKGEIDLSQISIERGENTIAFDLGTLLRSGDVRTFYLPATINAFFYCPTAKTIAEVVPACSGALSFSSFPSTQYTSDGSYVTVSAVGGMYKVVTNSTVDDGGGEGGSGPAAVPEFNLTTLLFTLLATLIGISVIRKRE